MRSSRNLTEVAPLATAPSRFPAGFLWGVSTAAHQVEGGNDNNQWAAWEQAGGIKSGDRSGQACDWWNNAERDFDLAREMGVNALRLSVEWSRIEPQEGQYDAQALRRYRQMLEALHQRGIRPMVCLHHFTHPLWFEQKGGFLRYDAANRFEGFARHVVSGLGDLCQSWVTFNEPNVYATLGYVLGEFPPGKRGQILTAVRLVNALARAHTQAYRAIHDLQPAAQVGWAHNFVVFQPADPRSVLDGWVTRLVNELFNESFVRLIEQGKLAFPLSLVSGDLNDVKGVCDFVGLNVYSRFHVAFDARLLSQMFARVFVPPHVPQGDHGVEQPYGEAYPAAIRLAVERVARIGKPIYVLENGVPDAQDRIRPWLIVNAVQELDRLIQAGQDIRGYFHWTLTDNFEWSEGWKLRFGLVALDPKTQQRTMRNSGRLYGAIARSNCISPEMVNQYFPAGIEPAPD
ncbi:MAG: glycoside hydrolase family 1 protein [Acidobacteriia bacterium]|nr:glycoside hydrolase family 1 protein [Terriglobia bacterium]